ncbi:MAG: phosphomannomutase [Desulfuromonas sp.]|nr:MAG: phosphomannomutase [Desulfuromonas sp.]
MKIDCFKAYDIRGRIPDQLNEEISWRIGRSFAAVLSPGTVVVGRDVRLSSESLCSALAQGLMDGGADVLDIGLCGTEEIYHAAFSQPVDGGIMVTASHNPIDWNGMKLVKGGAVPISGDSGLDRIRQVAEQGDFSPANQSGVLSPLDLKSSYVAHLLSYVERERLAPLKIVVNPGNGCAGPIIELLRSKLPFEFVPVHFEPDGTFPNGIPNPLLPENRHATAEAVRQNGADFGIAWDGDFDRCFFFDEQGNFIEGYYIVGLLAQSLLAHHPGSKIIHDPRLTWNTIDIVRQSEGLSVQSKTGHAFIKERMRKEDAVYGGEMSAHHYFREFAYCDSGMIPWLLIAEMLSLGGSNLSDLVGERQETFPASGEINRTVADPVAALRAVEGHFEPLGGDIDRTDGLSMEFPQWRFNLRMSNTEPLLRLNVESRGDPGLMQDRTREILALIEEL